MLAGLRHVHVGVAGEASAFEAGALPLPSVLDAPPHRGGRLGQAVADELLVLDAGRLDEQVDPVEQRAADALLVAGDSPGGADALLARVAVVAAGTGVHRAEQHESGGKGRRPLGAADGDDFVFHGLAQNFEGALAELGELVEEEDAAVGEADLAGSGPAPAADEAGVRDGVVGRAEGPRAYQGLV